MARFATYYIKYHHEFAPYDWEDRQKHFGTLFDTNDSIEFSVGEGKDKKVYNHRIYHLQNNENIIVMQFANCIDIPIEKNYEPDFARDEPSCFIIIDNRQNQRAVAIQKRKKAFGNPGLVARILSQTINDIVYGDRCYSLEILPEFYPEDLFKAWEKLQRNVQSMRFGVPEMGMDEIIQRIERLKTQGKDYFDDSLMTPLLQMALEAKKAKYKQMYTVMPEDKKNALYVDKSSVFMKNLLTLSRAIDMPVELVTSDAGTFKCFVETDEDNTDKIVCREFDADLLEQLFSRRKKDKEMVEQADINRIEGEIVELLNGISHESEDDMGEYVA